jgi:hypothetical protein
MLKLIRKFLRQKPFRPFRIVMRSGERYDIVDPFKVAVGPKRAFALLPPREAMKEMPESEIELVYEPRKATFSRLN